MLITGFPRQSKNECCPSNFNYLAGNDCSGSPNNGIESTFGNGNVFHNNRVNENNYGLWLGYSHNNTVSQNAIGNSLTAAIAIQHGYKNLLESNTFSGNDIGIWLMSQQKDIFRPSKYACLNLPNTKWSTGMIITGTNIQRFITFLIIFNRKRY